MSYNPTPKAKKILSILMISLVALIILLVPFLMLLQSYQSTGGVGGEFREAHQIPFFKERPGKALPMMDTDKDGLPDIAENYIFGTNPEDKDTDDDDLPDGWEGRFARWEMLTGKWTPDPNKADADQDYDGDGLTNRQEYEIFNNTGLQGMYTDPMNPDSDGDGMDDGWEYRYGRYEIDPATKEWGWTVPLNPLDPSDGRLLMDGPNPSLDTAAQRNNEQDIDGDELSNFLEYYWATDPTRVDTDGDSYETREMNDYWEVTNFVANRGKDDATDPTRWDTDGDMMGDGWEMYYGLRPNNASDRFWDMDGDGLQNFLEFRWDTDPMKPDSDHAYTEDGDRILDPDGMSDGWEALMATWIPPSIMGPGYYSVDPQANDARQDRDWKYLDGEFLPDPDGLLSLEEYYARPLSETEIEAIIQLAVKRFALESQGGQNLIRNMPISLDMFRSHLQVQTGSSAVIDRLADEGIFEITVPPGGSSQMIAQRYSSYWTNPNERDTDGDGLGDGAELKEGFHGELIGNVYYTQGFADVYYTNATLADSDSDGSHVDPEETLTDYEETMVYRTNATNPDTDIDGLPDYKEIYGHYMWGGLPVYTDPNNKDTDFDELTDKEELFVFKTNPVNPDTDGDGLLDGHEVRTDFMRYYDFNGDGDFEDTIVLYEDQLGLDINGDGDLADTHTMAESDVDYWRADMDREQDSKVDGTDPLNPDTDGDGMGDGWEAKYGWVINDTDKSGVIDDKDIKVWIVNPLIPTDWADDPDKDLLRNRDEFEAQSYPLNPDSDNGDFMLGKDFYAGGQKYRIGRTLEERITILIHGVTMEEFNSPDYTGWNPEVDPNIGCPYLGDGMPDGWEVKYREWTLDNRTGLWGWNLDPLNPDDWDKDPDEDSYTPPSGLGEPIEMTNLMEYRLGRDEDGDGIKEKTTDPNNADSDGDGIMDGYEVYWMDSDADWLPDWWEILYGLDPYNNDTDSTGYLDPIKDRDGDTFYEIEEMWAGTDPLDPASKPDHYYIPRGDRSAGGRRTASPARDLPARPSMRAEAAPRPAG